MSEAKYSVLFMRDDSDVRRYRIRPFWLKFFFLFMSLLILCAGLGAYVGYTFWKGGQSLKQDNKSLQQRLVEAEVRLERLGNMEKILESHDPAELQALLNATPTEPEPAPEPPKINLNSIFDRVDKRLVAVENMQARISGRNVTASFDLNNLQTSNPLSGHADFQVVLTDGETVDIKTNRNDLSFQIQRFKRMRTTFTLPGGMDAKGLFGLRVVINGSDGQVVYRETYPLYNILAS